MILGEEDVTRTRYAAGSRGSDGRYTPGAATTATIRMAFQPASADDLQTLPEGERHRDTRKGYTESDVRVVDLVAGTKADEITVDGIVYEVRTMSHWRAVLPHYECLLLRFQEEAP